MQRAQYSRKKNDNRLMSYGTRPDRVTKVPQGTPARPHSVPISDQLHAAQRDDGLGAVALYDRQRDHVLLSKAPRA